MNKRITWRKTD